MLEGNQRTKKFYCQCMKIQSTGSLWQAVERTLWSDPRCKPEEPTCEELETETRFKEAQIQQEQLRKVGLTKFGYAAQSCVAFYQANTNLLYHYPHLIQDTSGLEEALPHMCWMVVLTARMRRRGSARKIVTPKGRLSRPPRMRLPPFQGQDFRPHLPQVVPAILQQSCGSSKSCA